MNLLSAEHGDTTVLSVSGRLDTNTAPEFDQARTELIGGGGGSVVLDCGGLEYISSAGLRSILALAKALHANGRELKVCGLAGIVREVFEISGFSSMLAVYDSLEEALASPPPG